MSVVAELPGFIQVFSDGTVKRFPLETTAASPESSTNGYRSKDVVIDSTKPITARIFLPDAPAGGNRFPVIAYFHGGGFCFGSTKWLGFHNFLGDLSVASQSIVFSVDYRLAPENKLPTAYEDCYYSIQWLSLNVGIEQWLEKADISRVFLAGESAGGNICHQVAVMEIKNRILNVQIRGVLSIHSYFGTEERTELELAETSAEFVALNDVFWDLSIPRGYNRDFYGCNFEKGDMMYEEEWALFPAVVVYVAGLDFLKERGIIYSEFLEKKGVRVKLVEAEGETHAFHLFHPDSESTRLLQKQMTEFTCGSI